MGNLRLIKNQNLRKLFTKGPDFRVALSLNYSRSKKDIERATEEFAGTLRLKYKLEDTAMELWVNKVKEKVKNKIKSLKKSKKNYNTSRLLQDEEVRQYLKDLHKQNFAFAPIDKASNNLLFYFIYSR